MSKNYFSSSKPNAPSRLYRDILLWFKEKQYSVDSTESNGVYLIQAAKSGKIRTLLGTNLAFKVKIYESDSPSAANEFIVETTTGKWVQNLAGAGITAMFTGGFTILTGVAGAGWALVIENELINYIETSLKFPRLKREETTIPAASSTIETSAKRSGSDSISEPLQQLEKALAEGILTEEEFQVKKVALEIQAKEYELEAAIQKKLEQLYTAFSNGILDADEYEAKVKAVEISVQEQTLKEKEKEKAEKIAKFKEALNHGILTEEEYQAKIAKL
ncbi:MAG: SHOCT domain-containing protein [Chroococcales cyanobacterium]